MAITYGFPRLAWIKYGDGIASNQVNFAARHQLVNASSNQNFANTRNINPGIKLVQYQQQMEIAYNPSTGQLGINAGVGFADLLHECGTYIAPFTTEWLLRTPTGQRIYQEWYPNTWITNMSTLCPENQGIRLYQHYATNFYLPEIWGRYKQGGSQAGQNWIDGVYFDNTFDTMSGFNPDMNGSLPGVPDAATADAAWRAGEAGMTNLVREGFGAGPVMLGGGHCVQEAANGRLLVNFGEWQQSYIYAPIYGGATFREGLATILDWEQHHFGDHYSIVVGMSIGNIQENLQGLRYALATACIGGVFFAAADDDIAGYSVTYWLDEFSVNRTTGQAQTNQSEASIRANTGWLGLPVSPPQALVSGNWVDVPVNGLPLTNTSSLPNVPYRRLFEHGIALVNPTNSQVTIQLGKTYQRIQGTGQWAGNNGQSVTSVTLAARDGILLLGENTPPSPPPPPPGQAGDTVARPISTVSTGSYFVAGDPGADLHTALDEETPDAADHIVSAWPPDGTTCRFALSAVDDPGIHSGHVLSYLLGTTEDTGVTINVTVRLYSEGIEVASFNHALTTSDQILFEQTLSDNQAANITRYDQLEVAFTATTGTGSGNRSMMLSWVEFRVPEAPAPPPPPPDPVIGIGGIALGGPNVTGVGTVRRTVPLPAPTTSPRQELTPLRTPGCTVGLWSQWLVGYRDGAGVHTWFNAASPQHALQATAGSQPTFHFDVVGEGPAIRWDGTDDSLAIDQLTLPTYFTLIAALKLAPGGSFLIEHGPNAYASGNGFFVHSNANSNWCVSRDSVVHLDDGHNDWIGNDWAIIEFVYSETGGELLRNGVIQPPGAITGSVLPNRPYTDTLYLGSREGTSIFSAIDLAGLFLYTRPLLPLERKAIREWLAQRLRLSL